MHSKQIGKQFDLDSNARRVAGSSPHYRAFSIKELHNASTIEKGDRYPQGPQCSDTFFLVRFFWSTAAFVFVFLLILLYILSILVYPCDSSRHLFNSCCPLYTCNAMVTMQPLRTALSMACS